MSHSIIATFLEFNLRHSLFDIRYSHYRLVAEPLGSLAVRRTKPEYVAPGRLRIVR